MSNYRNYTCPGCMKKDLKITHSMELGPDHRSDERSLQTIECSNCGFKGIAVYEESRRGAFDSESWHHDGYRVPIEVFEAVKEAVLNNTAGIHLESYTGGHTGIFHLTF